MKELLFTGLFLSIIFLGSAQREASKLDSNHFEFAPVGQSTYYLRNVEFDLGVSYYQFRSAGWFFGMRNYFLTGSVHYNFNDKEYEPQLKLGAAYSFVFFDFAGQVSTRFIPSIQKVQFDVRLNAGFTIAGFASLFAEYSVHNERFGIGARILLCDWRKVIR